MTLPPLWKFFQKFNVIQICCPHMFGSLLCVQLCPKHSGCKYHPNLLLEIYIWQGALTNLARGKPKCKIIFCQNRRTPPVWTNCVPRNKLLHFCL